MLTTESVMTVASAIQQAVAPAFLMTGIGGFLNVLAGRLARVVDRFRILSESCSETHTMHHDEMRRLLRRSRWIHWSISFCTVSALLTCMVIATLFMGSEMNHNPARLVSFLFILSMVVLIVGLFCFLREIALAATNIDLPEKLKTPSKP